MCNINGEWANEVVLNRYFILPESLVIYAIRAVQYEIWLRIKIYLYFEWEVPEKHNKHPQLNY